MGTVRRRMISFIVPYKNLLKTRKNITIGFFDMINEFINSIPDLECIVSDFGSDDGIKKFLTQWKYEKIRYVYTEPNENQFINIPKCLNNGVKNARNSIISATGPDLRFKQELIFNVINLFKALGQIILRVQCLHLNKENKIERGTFAPYFLHKRNIYEAGGWDERMYGWGKEEDDLIERIFRFQKIFEIKVRGLSMYHIWHDDSFKKKYDSKNLRENHNAKILIENITTKGQNVVNSYW